MKIEKDSQEWRELTFAQRVGKVKFDPADVRKLPEHMRMEVWIAIKDSIAGACSIAPTTMHFYKSDLRFYENKAGKFWLNFAHEQGTNAWSERLEFTKYDLIGNLFRTTMLDRTPWEFINVLECMFRTPGMPKTLAKKIEKALEDSPYHLDISMQPVSIVPALRHVNKLAVQRSIILLRNTGMTEAAKRFQKSARRISEGDYPSALEESGRALEAIAHLVDPATQKKSLGECMKSQKIRKILEHGAFHSVISKLYGYLSDEPGVRHVRGNQRPKVDRDRAIVIYEISAALAEYFVNQHRKSKTN